LTIVVMIKDEILLGQFAGNDGGGKMDEWEEW
jgi:hypothetical protein